MNTLTVVVALAVPGLLTLALAVRIVQQYEQGVVFRPGRLRGSRPPGLAIENVRAAINQIAQTTLRKVGVSQPDGAVASAAR